MPVVLPAMSTADPSTRKLAAVFFSRLDRYQRGAEHSRPQGLYWLVSKLASTPKGESFVLRFDGHTHSINP
jgi:hypothetical protein